MPGGKPFSIILFAIFVDIVGFGIIVPILPFLTMSYGGGAITGSALMAIYALMTFLGGPLWGRLSDKIGRRPTLIATFFGSVVAYTLLAFADSLEMLFLARGFAGLMAGNVGIAMAATADLTTPQERGKALGLVGAAFGFGFAMGPAIGGLLSGDAHTPSIMLPALVAAGASFIALSLTYLWFPETKPKEDALPDRVKIPARKAYKMIILPYANLFVLMIVVVSSMAQSSSFSISPWWAQAVLGWSQVEVGFLLMAAGIIIAVIQSSAVGPMFRKFGEAKTLAIGNIIQMIGCIMLMLTPGSYQAFIALPLVYAGLTFTFPALNALISKRTPSNLQGTALGLSQGLSSLGRVIGPLMAGGLFEYYTPVTPFMMIGAFGVIIIGWAMWDITQRPHMREEHL